MARKSEGKFKVKVKKSSAGLGLFALEHIPRGKTVIEYVGHRVPKSVGDTLFNKYVFNVNNRFDIDGSPRWNTARYINHSCRPNCEAINRKGRVFIVSRRNILAGEELSYDYGKEYFQDMIKGVGCRCEKCS